MPLTSACVKIRQWIELQPLSVGLDNGEAPAFVPVETLAAIEPAVKAVQGLCQRARLF